jgi:hypothetical protein
MNKENRKKINKIISEIRVRCPNLSRPLLKSFIDVVYAYGEGEGMHKMAKVINRSVRKKENKT